MHETIVDEKLAPSGRDEERERQRSEIGRDTHVHARARTTGCTCMRAVVPRERERERTRKSERGRREIATLATTGATLLHTLFCRKSSRTTSTRKKIYAPILCVRTSLPVLLLYTLAIPSSSSPRSNDSLSFFLSVLRSFSPIYVRACIRVCICARLYPLRVSNPWCECARERRKENEWNRDRGRLTRECGTERKGGARGGGARSGE